MKRSDHTLWAIKWFNGQPLRAIGPLSVDFARNPNVRLNWRRDSIDAAGWGMGNFVLAYHGTRIGRQA